MPQTAIPLEHALVENVHAFLSEYLEEEELSEPLSGHIAEWFGF